MSCRSRLFSAARRFKTQRHANKLSTLVIRRCKSSSASVLDFPLPDSVRDAVKSSLLNEATKTESTMWTQRPPNGSHAHQEEHGDLEDINTSSLTHDPLDEWFLDRTTRYLPEMPHGVCTDADPFLLTHSELDSLSDTIRQDLLGTDHPVLNQAASYFFDCENSGKKVRPMMVLLISRALSETVAPSSSSTLFASPQSWQRRDLPQAQRRLAEISEMIHTASLFHDDVIDGADTRRGYPTVHKTFGNKMAILGGDYLLARASINLARLRNPNVVECMSCIIEHLVRGEVMQLSSSSSESGLVYYLRKNFYKTASLMANSCKSAALLGNYSPNLVEACYKYGKHVGMAFQLVDDVLDFEGTAEAMGKPALSDLKSGLATAPILFCSQEEAMVPLMKRNFKGDGDVERAVELVIEGNGLARTKELAQVHAELAMEAVLELGDGDHRDALVQLAYKVVDRTA